MRDTAAALDNMNFNMNAADDLCTATSILSFTSVLSVDYEVGKEALLLGDYVCNA